MARSMAVKRLMHEYKELTTNPVEGVIAGPASEDDVFVWNCQIAGPEGCPYEDGVFDAILKFPSDYPLSPPEMIFTSEMWHPNIYEDGRVCISILHPPGNDPMGYELGVERWSPVQTAEKILLSVMSMLAEPNDESPANIDAAKQWRDDREGFDARVMRTVEMSLGL